MTGAERMHSFFHVEVQDAAEKPVAHIGGVPLCQKCEKLLSDSIIALVRGWCEPNQSRTSSAKSKERSENESWQRDGLPPLTRRNYGKPSMSATRQKVQSCGIDGSA